MDKVKEKINALKTFFNKDITEYVQKHKIPLIGGLVVFLLACIGMFVTYAFYQVSDITPVIGGTTGEISDLDIRVMAEERDANGSGLGSYSLYPYVPKAGYQYNASKSYCTNGSQIVYNAATYDADITAQGHDVCYLYFDSTANLDLTLYVYAENIDSDGYGTGEYTKLETTALPTIGYTLNAEKSSCENGSILEYLDDENMFSIDATRKDVCTAYMDAVDVDIQLKLMIQVKSGSSTYYESKTIPNNVFYELGEQSACTGSANADALSIKNQKVVIAAASRTSCVAYLDVSSGPVIESMEVVNNGSTATINITNSNVGTTPTTYYYSSDNGKTYIESTNNSYTFNIENATPYYFSAYSVDANNKSSAIATTEDFLFNGFFDYANYIQEITIPKDGYYLLEVWGAEGGSASNGLTRIGGYGSYSKGITQLTEGTKLYIVTGGKGSNGNSTSIQTGGYNGGGNGMYHGGSGGGATHIATQTGLLSTLENKKDAILIVAGGGGGGAVTNTSNCSSGGHGGGMNGVNAYDNCPDSQGGNGYGTGGTQLAGGYQTSNGSSSLGSGKTGLFGLGATSTLNTSSYGAGGGGGGWYGGGSSTIAGAGGGSGYIGNTLLISSDKVTKSMYCYNCTTSSVVETLTYSTNNVSSNPISGYAKQGNGYAIVSYLGNEL